MFCKKDAVRNFAKLTGKRLSQGLFFNKVAALSPATLYKKRFWQRCFPVKFAKFLRTHFLAEQAPMAASEKNFKLTEVLLDGDRHLLIQV